MSCEEWSYPRGRHDAETCEINGWGVGTTLIGDQGYGPAVIEITGIGRRRILAVCYLSGGRPRHLKESSWTLDARDWKPAVYRNDEWQVAP